MGVYWIEEGRGGEERKRHRRGKGNNGEFRTSGNKAGRKGQHGEEFASVDAWTLSRMPASIELSIKLVVCLSVWTLGLGHSELLLRHMRSCSLESVWRTFSLEHVVHSGRADADVLK